MASQGPLLPIPKPVPRNGKPIPDYPDTEYRQEDNRQLWPPVIVGRTKPQRPSFTVRLWRSIRRLVRKRQESQLVWDARTKAATARAEHVRKQRELEEELIKRDLRIKQLEEQVRKLERELATLKDSELPRLNNKIGVLEYEVELLGAKHERDLAREKAEIATYNQRIVGNDPAENWQRRMMGE